MTADKSNRGRGKSERKRETKKVTQCGDEISCLFCDAAHTFLYTCGNSSLGDLAGYNIVLSLKRSLFFTASFCYIAIMQAKHTSSRLTRPRSLLKHFFSPTLRIEQDSFFGFREGDEAEFYAVS